jgi:CheY-like chemotaxis protein
MSNVPFVIVVEDDPTNRLLATRIFRSAGIEFAEAVDGEHALTQIFARTPDLVMMDLSLPGIDGLEVTRRVRQDPNLRDLPILGVSAHAMSGDRERALAAGCNDYLTKPYRPADLIAAVGRFVQLPEKPAAGPPASARPHSEQHR